MMNSKNYKELYSILNIEQSINYRSIAVVSYYNGDDFNLFIKQLPDFFDAVIIIDYSENKEAKFQDISDRVILSLKSLMPKTSKEIWGEIYSYVSTKWVCFLEANEHFDNRFCQFNKITENENLKAIAFHKVVSLNNADYFEISDSNNGIFIDGAMFNTLLNPIDEIIGNNYSMLSNDDANIDKTLVICNIKNRDKSFISLQMPTHHLDTIYRITNKFDSYDIIKDSELTQLIEQKIDLISQHLLKQENTNDISLYIGGSGTALFFAQMYLKTQDEKYLDRLNELIDSLNSELESGNYIHPSFCSGLAGYGWLICYLQKNNLIDVDDDYFKELDLVLEEELHKECSLGLFDQMHGAISIGRYFIARKDKKQLSYLIDELYKTKDSSFNEVKWKSYNYLEKLERYDTGLAHGMAGVLYFLSKCYSLGVSVDLCKELIDGIFMFYKNNEQSYNVRKTFFPTSINILDYKPSLQRELGSRSAWCYGDIGVLYSLFICGKYSNNDEMINYAIDRLKIISNKIDPSEAMVHDAMFCHGSCALAYMYNKIYYYTGDDDFKRAAKYWYKLTLAFGSYNISETSYLFFLDAAPTNRVESDGLLEGNIGVGLTFISAIDYKLMDWDECMMLS